MSDAERQGLLSPTEAGSNSSGPPWVRFWSWAKATAKALKREVVALYIAMSDERLPILPKILAAIVIGYALSPFDLIPDCIPVLGILDDIILLPLGIWIILRLIPDEVITDARQTALEMEQDPNMRLPTNWIAGGVVVFLWILASVWLVWTVWQWFKKPKPLKL